MDASVEYQSGVAELEPRAIRGLQLAATRKLVALRGVWQVPSQSGNGSYLVDPADEGCTCPDRAGGAPRCKHLWAVFYAMERDGVLVAGVAVSAVAKKARPKPTPAAPDLVLVPAKADVELAPAKNGKGRRADVLALAMSGKVANPSVEPWLAINDVAALYGVNRSSVYDWLERDEALRALACRLPGRGPIRFPALAFRKWFEGQGRVVKGGRA